MDTVLVHCYRVSAFLYFTGIILFHCYRVSAFLYFTDTIFIHCYPVSVFLYFTGTILVPLLPYFDNPSIYKHYLYPSQIKQKILDCQYTFKNSKTSRILFREHSIFKIIREAKQIRNKKSSYYSDEALQ